MANVHVVTESLACLPHEADVNYAIRIVDHRVEGLDGPLTLDALLERLSAEPRGEFQHVRPDAAAFAAVFDELIGWGVEIVSIHPPSGMGGCAEAAREAAGRMASDVPISIVETGCAGPALGLVALTAAVAGDSADRRSVVDLVSAIANRMRQVFVSTDSGYLGSRGYDVQGADGVDYGGDLAQILELQAGRLTTVASAHPAADALRSAFELISQDAGTSGSLHLALASAGADAEVAALATFLGTRLSPAESWLGECDPVLALELGRRSYCVAAWDG